MYLNAADKQIDNQAEKHCLNKKKKYLGQFFMWYIQLQWKAAD